MSFQKCPICEGTGEDPKKANLGPLPCEVCKGKRVIDTATALPPADTIELRYVPEMKAEDIVRPLSALDDLSDDEILYYATPYYDELQAQKEARAKQIDEEEES